MWNNAWDKLNELGSMGTALIESTEQYAKDLAAQAANGDNIAVNFPASSGPKSSTDGFSRQSESLEQIEPQKNWKEASFTQSQREMPGNIAYKEFTDVSLDDTFQFAQNPDTVLMPPKNKPHELHKIGNNSADFNESVKKLQGDLQAAFQQMEEMAQKHRSDMEERNDEISKLQDMVNSAKSHRNSALENQIANLEIQLKEAVEKYQLARKEADSLNQMINEVNKDQPSQAQNDSSDNFSEISLLREKNGELENKLETLRTKAKSKIQELQSTVNRLTQDANSSQESSTRVQNLEREIDRLKSELDQKSKVSESGSSTVEINEDQSQPGFNSKLDEEKISLKEEIQKLEKMLEEKEKVIRGNESRISESNARFQEDLNRAVESINAKDSKINALLEQINDMENRLSQSFSVQQNRDTFSLTKDLTEKDELIKALERQIEGLHKVTITVQKKEQEVQKLNQLLEQKEDSIRSLGSKTSSLQNLIASRDETISNLQNESSQLNQKILQLEQNYDSEKGQLLTEIRQLKDENFVISSLKSDLDSKITSIESLEAENNQLRTEMAQLHDRITFLGDSSSALKHTENQLEQAQSQIQEYSENLEKLKDEVETARTEFLEKDRKIHEHSILVDQLREENAQIVGKHAKELESLKALLKDKISGLRQASAEYQTLSDKLNRSDSEKTKLEAGYKQQINELNNDLTVLSDEVESLKKNNAILETSNNSLSQKLSEKSVSGGGSSSKSDLDRIQNEWKEKYQLLEHENVRLRDRTLRVETLLNQQSSSMSERSNQDYHSQITTLPWMEIKQEDPSEFDVEAPSRNAISRGNSSIGIRSKYFVQKHARNVLRALDLYTVKTWNYLRSKPLARLSTAAYAILIHAFILYLILISI